MRLRIARLLARSLFVASLAALPFAEGGCGRTACFTWSTQEGTCPSQSQAMTFFSDPKCPGKVTSVDSAPTTDLDGTLCCYEVTQRAAADESSCLGTGGVVNSGSGEGFVSSAVGQGGFTSGGVGGNGGAGGDAPCLRCADAIGSDGSTALCESSAEIFNALFTCACSDACLTACEGTFCAGVQPDMSCGGCLGDASSQGCGNELAACANDE